MSYLSDARRLTVCLLVSLAFVATGLLATALPTSAKAGEEGPGIVYFPVTGHHVSDQFLSTWHRLGGLATFGYPLTEPLTDPDTGMTVQYFERERFELHPENAGSDFEVEFALLGDWLAEGRSEDAFAALPSDTPQPDGQDWEFFAETGHYLSNGFKAYWEAHGGLRIYGYPISEEFSENGLTVQYFERARFEWHPENAGTAWEIELGRLGADRAAALGIDTAAVAQQDGVPDYDESLWAPPPAEPRSISIPVLMYHRFSDDAARYQMPLWKFDDELDWLQANGYHAVTLTELYDYVAGTGDLPDNPVALTFDDSPASQWGAVQALNARGMRGTFFVLTGQAGLENWQLQDMAAHGHEIDSHTIDHADLTQVSDDRLWSELVDSRATLQAITGEPINFLAYPYGAYDNRVIATTQAAGYSAAVAAWGGTWWTPDKWWTEPRIEISGLLTMDEFVEFVQ